MIMSFERLLLPYLKRFHTSIHEYGLGFIQIKVGNINYNFYDKRIKRFSDWNAPHSHQQDFDSTILNGRLIESVFEIVDGDDIAFCGCGNTEMVMEGKTKRIKTNVWSKGKTYHRGKNEFHTIEDHDDFTITRVYKYGERVDAFVFGRFENYTPCYTNAELWEMVEEIIKGASRG